MNRKQSTGNLLQQLPTKWAVTLVVAVIAYAFVQPVLNNRLGWSLPSVASLSGQGERADNASQADRGDTESDRKVASDRDEQESSAASGNSNGGGNRESSGSTAVRDSNAESQRKTPGGNNSTRGSPASSAKSGNASGNSNLKYGLLKSLGNEVYLSPAGLRYTKGSEEGHRLKHVEKHLSDQPSRPGSHGVFDGDMQQVLRWIDQAYELADRGAKGTTKRKDRGRVVMEAPFGRPIGFVGGQSGKRKGNPDAKRLRLVIDGDRVITAFPF